jgi:intron-binding protein aquarius
MQWLSLIVVSLAVFSHPAAQVQVSAITSSLREGLTLIVGPPGTGKTDVAVQAIANLYHNYPRERILIVTHSNNALNQIFEKIVALDIDERHLLRLGQGAEALGTTKDFSRYGRVDYMLALRLRLLEVCSCHRSELQCSLFSLASLTHLPQDVTRLAAAMDFTGDVGYTCETAQHFYELSLVPRWSDYRKRVAEEKNSTFLQLHFPFAKFFADAPQPLFGNSFEVCMTSSEAAFLFRLLTRSS